ncbi:MAG: hypothetical protein WCG48_01405, partial [Candidatus Berkelbacteria bacterium]
MRNPEAIVPVGGFTEVLGSVLKERYPEVDSDIYLAAIRGIMDEGLEESTTQKLIVLQIKYFLEKIEKKEVGKTELEEDEQMKRKKATEFDEKLITSRNSSGLCPAMDRVS